MKRNEDEEHLQLGEAGDASMIVVVWVELTGNVHK